jgi:hypothetical protein
MTQVATMETWGTLSTHDHRTSVLKKSLVLFDRLVIPVPDTPIYDITSQELDELNASVSYLEQNNAGISYEWKSTEFSEWRRKALRESLTVGRGDSLYDSRMMLVETIDDIAKKKNVSAIGVPVYGSRIAFEESNKNITKIEESLLVGLTRELILPDYKCPLETIIELRGKQSFQSALASFKDWFADEIPAIIESASRKTVEKSIKDFKTMLFEYNRLMESALNTRRKAVVVSVLGLGAGLAAVFKDPEALAFLAAAAPAVFSLDNLREPAWRLAQDSKFAPAGVIYEANKHVNPNENSLANK